jgi:hypothetical protein
MDLAKRLTELQFVTVHLLFGGPKTPGELRKALEDVGVGRSVGAFSRLVRRLEWDQCVEVLYTKPYEGRRLRECRLAATDIAVLRWKATRDFYAGFTPPAAGFRPVVTEEGKLAHLPARVRKGILKKQAKKEVAEAMEGLRKRLGL